MLKEINNKEIKTNLKIKPGPIWSSIQFNKKQNTNMKLCKVPNRRQFLSRFYSRLQFAVKIFIKLHLLSSQLPVFCIAISWK